MKSLSKIKEKQKELEDKLSSPSCLQLRMAFLAPLVLNPEMNNPVSVTNPKTTPIPSANAIVSLKQPQPPKVVPKTNSQHVNNVQRKKTTMKMVSGRIYDPTITFDKADIKSYGLTDFSSEASKIRIYIDEAWPGLQDHEYENIGVISGIVWIGELPDYNVLPKTETHLREKGTPNDFRNAVNNLLKCENAFPFIFPIIKDKVSASDYFELLNIALFVLLGWILPQDGIDCDVKIYCEGISTSQMAPRKNYADYLKGVRNNYGLTSGRMARWNISEFYSMEETVTGKSFEYIPYADTVGYLTIPTSKANYWSKPFSFMDWPGYVPLSRELLQKLVNLDSDSPNGYADELFDFAKTHQKTKLFYYVMAQAIEKAKANEEFRNALFEKLEKMFEQKERDVQLLQYLCERLSKAFPLDCFEGYPRQQLIRLLVEMQSENHSGHPENAEECARRCLDMRNESIIADNRELCAYIDMNLAVHYNDSLDFSSAAEISRKWEADRSFEFLSSKTRGIILSSIGQSYAFERNYDKANEYFRNAVNVFEKAQPKLMAEADQTAVYCALNALDSKQYDLALKITEIVFGCSFEQAIEKYSDNLEHPFHHHLLVKNLFFNPLVAQCKSRYLAHRLEWKCKPQHPWELIELYRILLLNSVSQDEAALRCTALWDLFKEIDGGTILKLIEVFAHCAIARYCGRVHRMPDMESVLFIIQRNMPKAAPFCSLLRQADAGELTEDEFWNILPFNYK